MLAALFLCVYGTKTKIKVLVFNIFRYVFSGDITTVHSTALTLGESSCC